LALCNDARLNTAPAGAFAAAAPAPLRARSQVGCAVLSRAEIRPERVAAAATSVVAATT
jgi:hypothetical protein